MIQEQEKKHQPEKDSTLPPDQETLHTPDPQEKMEGPVSSTMQDIGEGFEPEKSKEEADKKRDENM